MRRETWCEHHMRQPWAGLQLQPLPPLAHWQDNLAGYLCTAIDLADHCTAQVGFTADAANILIQPTHSHRSGWTDLNSWGARHARQTDVLSAPRCCYVRARI